MTDYIHVKNEYETRRAHSEDTCDLVCTRVDLRHRTALGVRLVCEEWTSNLSISFGHTPISIAIIVVLLFTIFAIA